MPIQDLTALLTGIELLRHEVGENSDEVAKLNETNDLLHGALEVLEAAITGLPVEIVTALRAEDASQSEQGNVSAFDRPQPVIVMGPNPLPVAVVASEVAAIVGGKGMEPRDNHGSGPPGKPAPEPRRGPGLIARAGASVQSSFLSTIAGVGAKFAAIAGPAAILATILQDTSSGFKLMGTGVKLVASVLAPILLPITFLLTAGLVSIAGVLKDDLEPILDEWFDLILSKGIPALEEFIAFLIEASRQKKGSGGLLLFGAGDLGQMFGRREVTGSFSGNPARSQQDRERARENVNLSLTKVLQSFRRSLGPQANISGLGDVGRQVQLSALNADPIDLEIQKNQLEWLKKIEAAVNRNRTPVRAHDPNRPAANRQPNRGGNANRPGGG